MTEPKETSSNFIEEIIEEDLRNNKNEGRVVTRFPPEPNGYMHIGHAKACCISYFIARKFNGEFHLRFDDTNPSKEEEKYVEACKKDFKWLGFDWGEHLYFASDYFEQMYERAVQLIKKGNAYVCDLNIDEIREYRGTLTEPGKNSPYRDRSIEENLELFERMKNGEFENGSRVLRAKIDMSSPNMNMRDPVMYRILKVSHHRTGDKWNIYPAYDWAHGLEDSIEKITHSLCSLEFEDHRPLYDWFLDQLGIYHPRQYEFARYNISYTVLSKRKLAKLIDEKHINGWDDPRMPTIAGLRRRGYTPESIRDFCERIGVGRSNNVVDIALLEHCLREDLNKHAQRVMAVLRPLKVVIDNYPEGQVEELDAENNPEDTGMGKRKIPFSRIIYIEQEDFQENPARKYFRLAPGREVRLKHAYYIKCEKVIKDEKSGEIIELHCTYDPETGGGWSSDGRKVKGTLHWVSVERAIDAEVRSYDRLFLKENPDDTEENTDFTSNINLNSLKILKSCKIEPGLKKSLPGDRFQFLRHGYFCVDIDSTGDKLIFNRTVSLRDTWAKIQKSKQNKS